MYPLICLLLALQLAITGTLPVLRGDDPTARAIAWLRAQQLPDGSFGVRMSGGRFVPSASTTADVAYVLALHGEDPAEPAWTQGGTSLLDALARLTPEYTAADAGQAGKVARAVVAAGRDPRSFGGVDLIERIQAAYDPQTGRYHPSSLFRHTLAIEGLRLAGGEVPRAALQALLDAQEDDGGWSWSFDGTQSDVDTTGQVMRVLAALPGLRDDPALTRAALYLCRQQQSDGGWGVGNVVGPSNANSTALAVAGLRAAGYDPGGSAFRRNGRTGMDALRSFQEPAGAFVYIPAPGREESRLMATTDALTALAQRLSRPVKPIKPGCRLPNRWPERPDDTDYFGLRERGLMSR
ncbi:MAG: hypothetical protein N2204_06405 [Anaerolineae bacterium]|nr:hypothetical protein [Anaerolineae bacterium]